jgi:hypothetical protein
MNAPISLKPFESETKSSIWAIDNALPWGRRGTDASGAPSKKNATGTCRTWEICSNRLAPMRLAWRTGTWKLEIVKRPDAIGFEILSKKWIVERTFAWISRNRRLARDFQRYATVAAFVRLAMIRIMLRRLAAAKRPHGSTLRSQRNAHYLGRDAFARPRACHRVWRSASAMI